MGESDSIAHAPSNAGQRSATKSASKILLISKRQAFAAKKLARLCHLSRKSHGLVREILRLAANLIIFVRLFAQRFPCAGAGRKCAAHAAANIG